MDLAEAQADMRAGYVSGAPGVLASSLAWWAAAATAWFVAPERAVWVLFVGGMLIHPAGILIAKLIRARGAHSKGNPLAELAAASTVWLILSLPLAFVASLQRIEWFFPAMLMIIGGRYLTFGPLYGMRFYWGLGLALAGVGLVSGMLALQPVIVAAAGAAVELVGAVIAFGLRGRTTRTGEGVA